MDHARHQGPLTWQRLREPARSCSCHGRATEFDRPTIVHVQGLALPAFPAYIPRGRVLRKHPIASAKARHKRRRPRCANTPAV